MSNHLNRPFPTPTMRPVEGARVTVYIDAILSCGHQVNVPGPVVKNGQRVGCTQCRDEYVKRCESEGDTFVRPTEFGI